jgi:Bax protein
VGVAEHYKVKAKLGDEDFFSELLVRVDYLPPSLALTQAAIESGWGSSRFSKQGNNLFGQWCFSKGCGIVPSSRDSDKDHEVAKFKTVNDSVRAYLRNLNTNFSYESLREKRANIRQNNGAITGTELAKTLLKYSEEGAYYVQKVTKFINQNKLQRFTAQFEQSLLPVE